MDGRGRWQKVDRGAGGVVEPTRSKQERSWMLNTASLLRVVAVWLLNENQRHGNVRFGLPCNWKHVSGETGRYRHQQTTKDTYLALIFVFDARRSPWHFPRDNRRSVVIGESFCFWGENRKFCSNVCSQTKKQTIPSSLTIIMSLYSEEHERLCRDSREFSKFKLSLETLNDC